MDVTKKVLPLYEKLFDVEYPLPKLDTLIVSRILSIIASFQTPFLIIFSCRRTTAMPVRKFEFAFSVTDANFDAMKLLWKIGYGIAICECVAKT